MPSLLLQLLTRLLFALVGPALAARFAKGRTRQIMAIAALIGAIGLALTGRVAFAMVLAAVAFMLYGLKAPSAGSQGTSAGGPGRSSSVRTAFLSMQLDIHSGQMTGHVLAGSLAGRELSSLDRRELQVLWQECRAGEPQSRQVLEVYLDRAYPEWRETFGGSRRAGGNGAAEHRSGLTRSEALEVLGLKPGAGEEEIRAAHRNLMKRFHPDQGGSNYLATKINEAKDVLLGKARGA